MLGTSWLQRKVFYLNFAAVAPTTESRSCWHFTVCNDNIAHYNITLRGPSAAPFIVGTVHSTVYVRELWALLRSPPKSPNSKLFKWKVIQPIIHDVITLFVQLIQSARLSVITALDRPKQPLEYKSVASVTFGSQTHIKRLHFLTLGLTHKDTRERRTYICFAKQWEKI